MLSLAKTMNKRTTCVLPRTSSRWLVHLHLNATPFPVVNAWLSASSSLSSLMMYLSTWEVSVPTSSTMMTSPGTSVLPLLAPKNIKKLRNNYFKFKMRNINKITAISHGCAAAISWTSSLISLGKSTSTWRPQTSHWIYSTLSQTTATRWASSTTPSRPSTFLRSLTLIQSSGKESVEPLLVSSRWLLPIRKRQIVYLKSSFC